MSRLHTHMYISTRQSTDHNKMKNSKNVLECLASLQLNPGKLAGNTRGTIRGDIFMTASFQVVRIPLIPPVDADSLTCSLFISFRPITSKVAWCCGRPHCHLGPGFSPAFNYLSPSHRKTS